MLWVVAVPAPAATAAGGGRGAASGPAVLTSAEQRLKEHRQHRKQQRQQRQQHQQWQQQQQEHMQAPLEAYPLEQGPVLQHSIVQSVLPELPPPGAAAGPASVVDLRGAPSLQQPGSVAEVHSNGTARPDPAVAAAAAAASAALPEQLQQVY